MVNVAAFATAAVDNPAALNQCLVIGGPEALSWRDVVAACGRAMGCELPLRFVAPGAPIPGQAEAVAGQMAAWEGHDSVLGMNETARTYGVELTPLEVVAERMFRGAGS